MSHASGDSGGSGRREAERICDWPAFLYFMDLEVKRARRYQNFFAVLILELSKMVSAAKEGDLEGSRRKLMQMTMEELRESDVISRIGGQRVAVLLPYADGAAAGHAKLRCEGMLKLYAFGEEGYQVKIEAVCFPNDSTDTAELLQRITGDQT